MQSAMKIVVSLVLLASALASAYPTMPDDNSAKLRRDGILNLYPFPRVGRSSHSTWQLPLNDMYLDYEQPLMAKRQLYAFPRVGRAIGVSRVDAQEFQPMPVRRTESPGMWFGPRLGRAGYKSVDDEITIHNEHGEPEQTDPLNEVQRRKRNILN